MATLLVKFTDERQYDAATARIIYADPTTSRWNNVFSKLVLGDNCIFHSSNKLYVGEFTSSVPNVSVTFSNIRVADITLDDVLRINALTPETLSEFKRPQGPILKENTIDVNLIYNAAVNSNFISFYVVKLGSETQLLPSLIEGDRVITLDDNRIINLYKKENGTLAILNLGNDYFKACGKSLPELKEIMTDSEKPNHIANIQRIEQGLANSNFYKFPSFTAYYNVMHNKRLFSQIPTSGGGSTNTIDDKINNMPFNMPLNTILYGPPGTGKTFISIDSALEIINGENEPERIDNKREFNKLQKEGRIFFTTFHQNMSYEDFIQGIKPIEPKEDDSYLQYEIQDGLFMMACIEATYDYIKSNFPQNEQENQIRTFNQLYNQLFEDIEQQGEIELPTLNGGNVLVSVTERGNFSVRHHGGTRTYSVSKDRLEPLFNTFDNLNIVNNIVEEFRAVIGGCNATAFWAILNAIKNLQPTENNNIQAIQLRYEDKKNIVKSFWKNADYTPIGEDLSNPFVFIIDEINRGNIAQIFGELITLIEDDKRLGKREEIRLELPYSKQTFSVPPNLYIIGTMNTADRSVEALDTALRRRFSFIPMMPVYDGLNEECDGVNLKSLLKKLNDRLIVLKDRDHTIGHAWLWNITTLVGLRLAFKDKIIPLLQEFFYNDYEKLGLLLGDRFIESDVTVSNNLFATFERGSGLKNQYTNKAIYKITEPSSWNSEAFQSIYKTQDN
jgi:Cdc6-like AAA superfamily ATPase